jgi:hypothetical protein
MGGGSGIGARRRRPSPSPLPSPKGFGGEVRVKDPRKQVFWDARPGVAHLDSNHVLMPSRAQCEDPCRHGIEGVVDQVRPHQVELSGVTRQTGQVTLEVSHHRNVRSEPVRQHRQRVVQKFVHIDDIEGRPVQLRIASPVAQRS